jgi:mannose-6-phosphate isomerase-like protein (cupin superfamily)
VRCGTNESTTKASGATRQLAAGPDVGVRDYDPALGTLKYLSARKKSVALRSETSATLCFIRGTGKMAVRDASVEYRDGKWFEIPGMSAYQIFPETDTVLLTIQKDGRASARQGKKHFAEGCFSLGR